MQYYCYRTRSTTSATHAVPLLSHMQYYCCFLSMQSLVYRLAHLHTDDTVAGIGRGLFFHHLKVFLMHASDGYGKAAKVKDQLAVTVNADYVALITLEWACEDTQLYVVTGKLPKGVTKKGDLLGMCPHHIHKRLHDGILDRGRPVLATVLDQMVSGEIIREKGLYAPYGALQEDETADGWFQFPPHTFLVFLVLVGIVEGLVDEEGLLGHLCIIGIVCFQPLLECFRCHVLEEKVTPGCGLRGGVFPLPETFMAGYFSYFRN